MHSPVCGTGDWSRGDGDQCATIISLPVDSTGGLMDAPVTDMSVLSRLGGEGGDMRVIRSLATSNASSVDGICRSQPSLTSDRWGPGLDWSHVGAEVNAPLEAEAAWPDAGLMVAGSF